jgi:hypothetical protein
MNEMGGRSRKKGILEFIETTNESTELDNPTG